MKLLTKWLVSAVAIAITAYLLPGVTVSGLVPVLVLAIVLGIINAFIKPILSIITFPLSVVTLGIFSLILNTLLIMLADAVVPGFDIAGFWWALLFGIVLALVSAVLRKFDGDPTT